MKLTQLRICNFQSFGPMPTIVTFERLSFLLGPNGAGKTAVLQALARLFGFDPSSRRTRRSDFHVPSTDLSDDSSGSRSLWIEAQFEFPEVQAPKGKNATIPGQFAHMQLETADGVPRIRYRLDAEMDEDGEIEDSLNYVLQFDKDEQPLKMVAVHKHDRNAIQVHYLPARRDPTDHISYAANALLGRALRAADWKEAREEIADRTKDISDALAENEAVGGIGDQLSAHWSAMHKGTYFASPTVSFENNEIENLLRHLTVGFSPGHGEQVVDFTRLSDGQQSLLYLSLVLSIQAIGRQVLAGTLSAFDVNKLRPAVFTLIAMEEPENSLSPHYLGRVTKSLVAFSSHNDAQAVIATHSPSLLKRVAPESIRYLRLNADRQTVVNSIILPRAASVACKFVREAVQAFPELYFSRLVILGEGDSEEIVLPRLLQARGLAEDDASISVVPLGGRHVNHFWRLLHGLDIPFVTLLDLDLGRNQGGWGRIKYALEQLLKFPTIRSDLSSTHIASLAKWNGSDLLLTSDTGKGWLKFLESAGVFFSSPLDLDFSMLSRFASAYGMEEDDLEDPDDDTVTMVLGKCHGDVSQYPEGDLQYFDGYYNRFKLGSKPAAHLAALARLNDAELGPGMPEEIDRLLGAVKAKLAHLPE